MERVLQRRNHPQRGLEYLVRWHGSDGSDDEWFPALAVENDYSDLLDVFEAACHEAGISPEEGLPSSNGVMDEGPASGPGEPQYRWKSKSLPPPKMTKKESKFH